MLVYIIIRESSYDYGDRQHIVKVTCDYSDALMYIKHFAKEAKSKYLKMEFEISTSYCKYNMHTTNAIFKSGDMYYIVASNYLFEIEESYIILTFELGVTPRGSCPPISPMANHRFNRGTTRLCSPEDETKLFIITKDIKY